MLKYAGRDFPGPLPSKTGWPWISEASVLPDTMSNGKPWPRISIVTPSYNQGQYIEETIRSVLLQGYPDLEYIIMDGGSTDQTVDIIKKYEPWITYWVSATDYGQTDAINKGFSKATGQILNWLNSDDFLERDALKHIAEAFGGAGENVGAIVGKGHFIDVKKRMRWTPFPDQVSRETLYRWPFGFDFLQPACFFSREAWQMSGPLPVELKYCMDVALWLRISQEYQFKMLPLSIAYAYIQPQAKTVTRLPYSLAELALFFAAQSDGQAAASAVMDRMLDRELKKQALRNNPALRRLGRQVGLGYLKRAIKALRRVWHPRRMWPHYFN